MSVERTQYICDRLREKEQFPAKVDFAIITPKVGGVNFGHSHLNEKVENKCNLRIVSFPAYVVGARPCIKGGGRDRSREHGG